MTFEGRGGLTRPLRSRRERVSYQGVLWSFFSWATVTVREQAAAWFSGAVREALRENATLIYGQLGSFHGNSWPLVIGSAT